MRILNRYLIQTTLRLSLLFACLASWAGLPDFVPLVDKYNTAVVNISAISKSTSAHSPQSLEDDSGPQAQPLDDFFKHYFGKDNGEQGGRNNAEPLGSGFLISSDGYIITNRHVVKDADEIIVKLQDRREIPATLVGMDKRSDVALLKIAAASLPTVKLGSSEALRVGEWVLAIGSPFGFDHSVTAGIVSAKGRSLPRDNYVPFIQTDVAINPGNSGGPLFNMQGEVIGVNSQIYSQTGGFMGLSFAIPIEVAMKVVEQLKAQGHVSRGWIGVQVQDVTRELAESFGMKTPTGALVSRILPNSPAAKAGLEIGDVIIKFNKQDIESSGTLPPLVGMAKIGETAKVTIIRNGAVKDVAVHIDSLPDETLSVVGETSENKNKVDRLGIRIESVPKTFREQYELPSGGVLVTELTSGIAVEAGMRVGDVIVKIQDQAIKDTNHYFDVVKALPKNKSLAVLVQRRDSSIFLALKIKD